MAIRRAKTITREQFNHALVLCANKPRFETRDRLKLCLSFKQGLRAAEIAAVMIEDVLRSDGSIEDKTLFVSSRGAKGKKDRIIDMHDDTLAAIVAHLREDRRRSGALLLNDRGKPYTANAMVQWFCDFYQDAGFVGCTSHTGRRSFGTFMARTAARDEQAMKDLSELMGHADPKTTNTYVEGSESRRRWLNATM